MSHKRKSDGGSEQAEKKQREEPAAGEPSSAAARAAHADALSEQARFKRQQIIECSKLARLVSSGDSRPLDQRTADMVQLLKEDEKREQPLLNLSHKLAAS